MNYVNTFIFKVFLAIGSLYCLSSLAHAQEVADANTAFLERASLRAADDTCKLLDERERLALEMGFWQARTALLRGGYDTNEVNALNDEAISYAASKKCDDEGLTVSNERLKNAFLAFSRTPFYEFRDGLRQWTASRTLTDVWAAYQEDPDTGARFGLIHIHRAKDPLAQVDDPNVKRPPTELATIMNIVSGKPAPALARLIVRDSIKSEQPWIGGLFGPSKGLVAPPNSISKKILAAGREIIDAPPYEDGKKTQGVLFLFDKSALKTINELDPREAIIVEIIPSDREKDAKPIRILFEVGDFRSAAAFSAIDRDPVNPSGTESKH